ncbi:cyclic nucleotide-binding domain-containing protein, partial [candidate division KSB1 bacterium]|nr:cyclic nucleotide-binding domain-containing protein [candidate division KSB1 bacterium]
LDLAFFIIKGSVEVYLNHLQRSAKIQKTGRSEISFLSSVDFELPASGGMQLGAGDFLGEIGAMNGWPQSVTARTATECVLLQIRVPALRKMKRRSEAFQQRLDKVYRERALLTQLKTTPLLRECEDKFISALAQRVELISCEPGEVITREEEPAEALYLVRAGFVKLTQRVGEGEVVVSYLSKGKTMGEIELLIEHIPGWTCTATSVEFSDLVKISRADLQTLLKRYPHTGKALMETAVARIKARGANKKNLRASEFLNTALEKGLVEGNSILVIDLDRCTRCDDCVRGCADTHEGRPRFVREGDKYQNLLIAKSCYHCHDPVCLVGCPTGAIHRARVGEVVEIIDDLCIGCKACANNCPYDAIVMHETGAIWPQDMLPEMLRGRAQLLASKCDLCYKTKHGPACVSNCPHGCAVRVGSLEEFQKMLSKTR